MSDKQIIIVEKCWSLNNVPEFVSFFTYFKGKKKKVFTEPKEMLTPALEKALTKQGTRR